MRIAIVGAEFEENLALRYLAGALQRDGHRVQLIAFNGPEHTEWAARALVRSGAALAGLSMVFTARAREFAALAARARELGFAGTLVAGGHFASFHAEELIRDVPALDAVALGEGEGVLCELASRGGDPAAVDGLVWRDPDGTAVRNTPRPNPADLDTLAPPARKLPYDRFLGLPIVNMLASRGCTHGCAFCSIAAWHKLCGGERYRERAVEAVADELAGLFDSGVRIFNFHDDNFLPRDPGEAVRRVDDLRRAIKRRGVSRIAVAIKCRPEQVRPDVIEALQRLGLFRVFLGIEAGTERSLRQLGRRQTVADNHRALEVLADHDVHACYNLLWLNPDSTLEDAAGNVTFLRDHPHNPMNFCRTEVYAGTPLERRLRRQDRLRGSYWGLGYAIADERAQRLFEVTYPAFRERNYGANGPHHLTMRVDFEHQLYGHFFGVDPALRRRVKDYLVAVNHDTCGHLDAIVAAVAGGDGDTAALIATFRGRVTDADARLIRDGERLLDELRRRVTEARTRPRYPWARAAAAAGIAATLTLATGCCKDGPFGGGGTHVYEEVALPLEGDPALVKEPLGKLILPTVSPNLAEPSELVVQLSLDWSGNTSSCTVTITETGEFMDCASLGYANTDPQAVGKEFTVRYTAEEVAAGEPSADPIILEPTTPPTDRPPTHIHEKIAAPTLPPAQESEEIPEPLEEPESHVKEMVPFDHEDSGD